PFLDSHGIWPTLPRDRRRRRRPYRELLRVASPLPSRAFPDTAAGHGTGLRFQLGAVGGGRGSAPRRPAPHERLRGRLPGDVPGDQPRLPARSRRDLVLPGDQGAAVAGVTSSAAPALLTWWRGAGKMPVPDRGNGDAAESRET